MNIQCPSCRTVARIPASKEGAKVRCPSCEHLYVARPPGARATGGVNPSIAIAGVAIVAIVALLFFLNRSKPTVQEVGAKAPVEEEVAPPPSEPLDDGSWDSPPVQAVADAFLKVADYDEEGLARRLDGRAVYAWLAAGGPPIPEGAPDADQSRVPVVEAVDWDALESYEQEEAVARLAKELVHHAGDYSLSAWRPYDGRVHERDDGGALVHVDVTSTLPDRGAEKRTLAVRVVQHGKQWKLASWERIYTLAELSMMKRKAARKYEKVELTDGSRVYEAEPEPLPHLDDTPQELRARIDELCARLIDLKLKPKENSQAKQELVAIGKPALPALLTKMYETPIEDEEDAIKLNLVNQALEEITGFYTGYKPQIMEGSATGTSEERRDSAIKQWFAWWHRKGKRFDPDAEFHDALEDVITPNARDLRQMEKDGVTPPGGAGGR